MHYTNSEDVYKVNYKINSNNEQEWLTDEAVAYIRHIIFCFNILTQRFSALLQCFAVLLLRKTIELKRFPDKRSLNQRFLQLAKFNRHRAESKLKDYITAQTEHRFYRYWYSVTDDSKHFKLDCHAVLMTYQDSYHAKPAFEMLTASPSAYKDSSKNSNLNVRITWEYLRDNIIARYGGNGLDYANKTLKEGRYTFNTLIHDGWLEHGIKPRGLFMHTIFIQLT